MSKSVTTPRRVPVLIAGAGPVGLALAMELAYRGIRCLVVEQTDGTVEFPTTNLANTRTVEHLRDNLDAAGWRLEGEPLQRLNEVSRLPDRYPENMEKNMHERRNSAVKIPAVKE